MNQPESEQPDPTKIPGRKSPEHKNDNSSTGAVSAVENQAAYTNDLNRKAETGLNELSPEKPEPSTTSPNTLEAPESHPEKNKNKLQVPEYVKKASLELARRFAEMFQGKQENTLLLSKMLKDKKVKEAFGAVARTLLNLGISVVDFFPGIGEVVSTAADLAKMTEFDPTPDVPKWVAWGSEVFEFVTGGAAPTHLIETTLQFVKDAPRIKEGMKRAAEIWKAHQAVVNSPKVRDAAAVFNPAPAFA